MKKFLIAILCLSTNEIFASLSNNSADLYDVKIIGITTSSKPFQNSNLLYRTIKLGEHQQAFKKLFGNLPNNPQLAREEIKRRQLSPDFQIALEQFKTSAKDTVDAWQYGIIKLPAVLFIRPNKQNAVVYGVIDVNRAIAIYKNYEKQG